MGENRTDLRWGVERRLEFIEFRLFWEGYVNRGDLIDVFGISVQQASTDLNRYLGLAPEGTRRYTDHWRTGFYHIAERSGARILLLYADYEEKVVGLGPVITPSGDMAADFEIIKAFYADKVPKRPENRSDAVLGEPRGATHERGLLVYSR